MLERLGGVNARAATLEPVAISRKCVATLLQRDGQAWFFPVGYPDDEDFAPPFVARMIRGIPTRRKLDDHGRPHPVRLTQLMANRRSAPDAVVVGLSLNGLER